MKKEQPDTYQFPVEIQKRFYRLINSKDDFLRNLSTAERRKLETLYAQLNAAWKANNTDQLSSTLTRKYHELRTSQHELNNNCSAFRHHTRSGLKKQFVAAYSHLQKRQEECHRRSVQLKQDVKTWKDDIIRRDTNWSVQKQNIDRTTRTKLSELQRISSNLEQETARYQNAKNSLQQKQQELTSELEKQSEQQQIFNDEQKRCQMNSDKLRAEWSKRIASKKRLSEQILDDKRRQMKKLTDEYERSLENDTKAIEEQWLKQLREQMANELSDCHPELLSWLKQGDLSSIHRRSTLLSKESEQLTKLLNQGLIRVGLSLDGFLAKSDVHQPVSGS